jgi:hypothetical protein
MRPQCPSTATRGGPNAPAPPTSSADARNRERDAWDDYIDAWGELRRTRSLRDAYVVAALFGRWLAMRSRNA